MAKKKRSVKRKAQAPLESSLAIRGKVPRLGASSPPSTAKGWGLSDQVPVRGQAPPPVVEVSKAAGPKNSSRRSTELPLIVLPISIRSPLAQDFKHPITTLEDEGRVASKPKGKRTRCLPSGPYRPFYGILISGGWMPCLLMRFWPYCFRERPPYVWMPLFVCPPFDFDLPLPLPCSDRWLPM